MNSSSWRERMHSDLVVAGMAERTREAYLRAVKMLSRFYNNADPTTLSEDQVKDYMLWMRHERRAAPGRAAPGTLKIMIGGLRFFYRRTCGLDWKTASQEQPGHKSHATDSVFPPDFCITAQQQKSEHRWGLLEQS